VSAAFTDIEDRIKKYRQTNLEILLKDQLSQLKEAKHFWQREVLLVVDS